VPGSFRGTDLGRVRNPSLEFVGRYGMEAPPLCGSFGSLGVLGLWGYGVMVVVGRNVEGEI
jgi:hypothetical protein